VLRRASFTANCAIVLVAAGSVSHAGVIIPRDGALFTYSCVAADFDVDSSAHSTAAAGASADRPESRKPVNARLVDKVDAANLNYECGGASAPGSGTVRTNLPLLAFLGAIPEVEGFGVGAFVYRRDSAGGLPAPFPERVLDPPKKND
jgi:hypothetical protein